LQDSELASQIIHDYTKADLDDVSRAMLDYAVKLTKQPWTIGEDDITALKDAGLSEAEILAINLITSLYAFMTRLTNGLGVEHRPGRTEQMQRWLTGPATDYEWLVGDE
jgi:uncharacterized peroxidase-related enzyme